MRPPISGRHAQVSLLLGADRSFPIPMARVNALELRVFGVHGMGVRHYPMMLSAIASGLYARVSVDGVVRAAGCDGRGALNKLLR